MTGQAKTFTPTDWDQPQEVTVTGVAAGASTITHSVSSSGRRQVPDRRDRLGIASVAATVTPSLSVGDLRHDRAGPNVKHPTKDGGAAL